MRNYPNADIDILRHILKYCDNIEALIARFGSDIEVFKADLAFRDSVSMNILQIAYRSFIRRLPFPNKGQNALVCNKSYEKSFRTQLRTDEYFSHVEYGDRKYPRIKNILPIRNLKGRTY